MSQSYTNYFTYATFRPAPIPQVGLLVSSEIPLLNSNLHFTQFWIQIYSILYAKLLKSLCKLTSSAVLRRT